MEKMNSGQFLKVVRSLRMAREVSEESVVDVTMVVMMILLLEWRSTWSCVVLRLSE